MGIIFGHYQCCRCRSYIYDASLKMSWHGNSPFVREFTGQDLFLSRDWLFLARDTVFFLTTGSCVSEPPTKGFLCVRARDNLILFLEWGNPLKVAPLQTENWSLFALHKLFVQRITSHGHEKIYVNKLWLHHAQIMAESFVLISSNLDPSSKIQNLFGHMTPLWYYCHMTLPLWLLGCQVIV